VVIGVAGSVGHLNPIGRVGIADRVKTVPIHYQLAMPTFFSNRKSTTEFLDNDKASSPFVSQERQDTAGNPKFF
jgi:hypothetical protein